MNTLAKPGIAVSGKYHVERFESRRLWKLRRLGLHRHGNPVAWRALHGYEFSGCAAQYLTLSATTRALIDKDIARDIRERPQEWEHPEVAEVIESRPANCNLVLDAALDNVLNGTAYLADLTRYCCAGTGTTPPAVSDTSLGSELTATMPRTGTMLTTSGSCDTTYGTSSVVFKRTHDFAAVSSGQNVTELGWSHASTAGANLDIRVLVSGGTVTLLTGQQLRTVHELTLNCSPTTTQSGTIGVSGWASTAGTWAWQSLGLATVGTSGVTVSTGNSTGIEPRKGEAWVPRIYGSCTLNSWRSPATLGSEITTGYVGAGGWQAYAAGSFTRTVVMGSIPANIAVSSAIRAITLGTWHYYGDGAFGATGNNVLVARFDNLQTKADTHTLRLPGFTFSLSR